MTLKPIETHYRGYRFRSRLEARWAVFFDALGVAFEYEPQGFELEGDRYLPDFWLPQLRCWVEIKGDKPNERELRVAEALARASDSMVFVFAGSFDEYAAGTAWGAVAFFPGEFTGYDECYQWCECAGCRTLGIQFSGAANRNCRCVEPPGGDAGYDLPWPSGCSSDRSPRLTAAYAAGMRARFERAGR